MRKAYCIYCGPIRFVDIECNQDNTVQILSFTLYFRHFYLIASSKKIKCVQDALPINRNNKKEHYAKEKEKVVKIPGLSRYYILYTSIHRKVWHEVKNDNRGKDSEQASLVCHGILLFLT